MGVTGARSDMSPEIGSLIKRVRQHTTTPIVAGFGFSTPEQVKQVAAAIADIDEAWMRERYFAIPSSDYGQPLSDEDCEYTWSWFQELQALFLKAAAAGRAVTFTVDQ